MDIRVIAAHGFDVGAVAFGVAIVEEFTVAAVDALDLTPGSGPELHQENTYYAT